MKRTFLFLAALCLAGSMWAYNVITYYATSKLEETIDQSVGGLYISGFGSPIKSHTFSNGKGTITCQDEITIIKAYTFYKCSELTGIIIPNSVTYMGEHAFDECRNITEVTWHARNCVSERVAPFHSSETKIISFLFGPEVEVIPDGLCEDMTKLTFISLPNSVQSIGERAFEGCRALTTVEMGNGVKTIGFRAFWTCDNLTSLTLSNTLTTIADEAFLYCNKLESVVLPESLTSLGYGAFESCWKLKSITIPSQVKRLNSWTFKSCSNLTSINLGQVERIDDEAFKGCDALTSITIPETLQQMAANVFEGCTALTTVNWNASNFQKTANTNGPLYILRNQITNVNFGDQLETIPEELCKGMTKLSSVTIPASVTTMKAGAFAECTNITSVTWNARNGFSEGYFPFSAEGVNEKLTSFTFGPEVETIPSTLCGYTGITSVTIPNSVRTIDNDAFTGCEKLTSVTLSNTLTEIRNRAFAGCNKLTSITLPASLQHIWIYAFLDCTGLQEIHCEAANPPSAMDNSFENVDFSIPVYIPAGTKSAYEAAEGWNHFSNFIDPADDPEGVDQLEASKQAGNKTLRNGQVVIIRGDKVYDMLGNEMK